jgi:hypothetical protein
VNNLWDDEGRFALMSQGKSGDAVVACGPESPGAALGIARDSHGTYIAYDQGDLVIYRVDD